VDNAEDTDVNDVSNIMGELGHLNLSSRITDAVGSELNSISNSSSDATSTISSAIDTDTHIDDDSSTSSSSSSSSSSSCSSASLADCFAHWRTSKIMRPVSLPEVLILQLSRSEFKQGRVQLISDAINVPYDFELESNSSSSISSCHQFRLIGAVVHTDKNESSSLDQEESRNGTGHYVTYIKEIRQNSACQKDDQELWIKMDDDRVSTFQVGSGQAQQKVISRNALCALFGGKTRRRNHFATLLLYKLFEE